jgi:hypothetical protein
LANVGGPGLEAQMRRFAPEHVDELRRVLPLPTTSRCTTRSRRSWDRADTDRPQGQGRRASGSSPRKRRSTVDLRVRSGSRRALLRHRPSARRDQRHKAGSRTAAARPRAARARAPTEAAYVGDSPYDMRRGEAGGPLRRRRHLGRDPRPGGARRRGRDRRHRGGAAWRPLSGDARGRTCARLLTAGCHEYHVLDDPSVSDADLRPRLRRARRHRGGASRARDARLADAARRCARSRSSRRSST